MIVWGGKYVYLRASCTRSVYGLRYSPYVPVNDRISPHTVTAKYNRNTGPCNMAKYNRKRIVYDRLRSSALFFPTLSPGESLS